MTDALPISRFPVPNLADMPEDIRNRISPCRRSRVLSPMFFLCSPTGRREFRAFFAYHDGLLEKPGNLTKAEREMIVVATSTANQCQYCVIAHGAILRIRAKNPLIADQVAINYRKADLTERQRLRFFDHCARSTLSPDGYANEPLRYEHRVPNGSGGS